MELLSDSDRDHQIIHLEGLVAQYHSLRARMHTLPESLSHDVMVPLGPAAFMQGKIVKTNEVLVLLGDNYFALRSAKQAIHIIERRLAHLQVSLDSLNNVNLSKPNIRSIPDLEGGEAILDIKEVHNGPSKLNRERIAHKAHIPSEYTSPKGISQAEFQALMQHLDDIDSDDDDSDSDDDDLDEIARRLSGLPLEESGGPQNSTKKVRFEGETSQKSREIVNVAENFGVESNPRSILKNKNEPVYVDKTCVESEVKHKTIETVNTVVSETVVEKTFDLPPANDPINNVTPSEIRRPISKFKQSKLKK